MKISRPILIITLLVSIFACREGNQYPPLSQVSKVDLNRYLGLWYEIARIDHSFQKDCVASTADYSLRPDGDIKVVNACRKKSLDGEITSVEGKAWVVNKDTNAWLKVQFFWPFRAITSSSTWMKKNISTPLSVTLRGTISGFFQGPLKWMMEYTEKF